MPTNKKRKVKTTFKFDSRKLDYEVQLKKKRNFWWLLLLLLIIPLFINLEKDITIKVLDNNNNPVGNATVDFEYTSFYFYRHGRFFQSDTIFGKRSGKTDNNGLYLFKDCGYSIYGMIFKCMHKATLRVSSYCHKSADKQPLFHSLFGVCNVWVDNDITDLTVLVLDKEDKEPITDAIVYFKYIYNQNTIEDSLLTDAAGRIFLKGIEKCGTIESLKGCCYGYHDGLHQTISIKEALQEAELLTLMLEPIKESINFFVVNCNSREPLTNAGATITVTNAQRTKTYNVRTNTDGRGRASWQDFHILSEISIVASKNGFKDGAFKHKYTVEQFIRLSDSLRTICLEPEPQTVEFINKDVLIDEGIKGVVNNVILTSATRTDNLQEISGKNGIFYVKTLEGDQVDIISELHPDYHPVQSQFTTTTLLKKNEILMSPRDTTLHFCVFDNDDHSPILFHSDLNFGFCYSNKLGCYDSTFYKDPSASCTILANIYIPYKISVTTKAFGYRNNEQIQHIAVKTLLNGDSQRQLPMQKECQGNTYTNRNNKYDINEYDLKGYNGLFHFKYNTKLEPDTIIIYDSPQNHRTASNIIFRYDKASKIPQNILLNFKSQTITVEVYGNSRAWDYTISCPSNK